MSITKRLVLIYMISTGLILGMITWLLFPTLQELSIYSSSHFLATTCIKRLFIGLWGAASVSVIACYVLSKHSLVPLSKLSSQLNSMSAQSLGAHLDISVYPKELKQLATTCNDLLSRIECSLTQMSQFSARVAHELRNPIHMLKTATEITLSGPADVDTYGSLIEQHLEEYHHLSQLIEKFLLLSRCEHKQLALSCQQYDAKDLINSVMEYFSHTAEDKHLSLSNTGNALIYVDRTLFRRVLANVFDNSIRHTMVGGSVSSFVSSTSTHVIISITDTGEGIAEEHLPYITQGFYRSDRSVPDKTHLGLGLAISMRIVECHGGTFRITSEPGVGTNVEIRLPSVSS